MDGSWQCWMNKVRITLFTLPFSKAETFGTILVRFVVSFVFDDGCRDILVEFRSPLFPKFCVACTLVSDYYYRF